LRVFILCANPVATSFGAALLTQVVVTRPAENPTPRRAGTRRLNIAFVKSLRRQCAALATRCPPCAARRHSAHAIPPVRFPEAFGQGDAEEPMCEGSRLGKIRKLPR
jgi:hypothetical protein